MEKIQQLESQVAVLEVKLSKIDRIGSGKMRWYALYNKICNIKREIEALKWNEYLAK